MKTKRLRYSLICVGNKKDFDSFMKFHRERRRFSRSGVCYHAVSYTDLLKGDIPKIKTEKVLFFLFFPYGYWNKNVETRAYKGIYGNKYFYKKFINFFKAVDLSIKKGFPHKKVYFVNPPILSAIYRDKLAVKKILLKKGLPTPSFYEIKNIKALYKYLAKGGSLFLKTRYGSMGKGITFVTPSACKTNFVYRNRRIFSRKSDYGWRFINIAQKEPFLKRLLRSDIYVVKGIDSSLIRKRKFDLRVYIFFKKALFVYPRSNAPENIITNIAQGGKGEYRAFLRPVPKTIINRVKKIALVATKALRLNFAGVDILIDQNLKDIYIVDVNLFPGFPKKKIFNLAKHLIEQLKKKASLRYL